MSFTYRLELAQVEIVAAGCDSITTRLSSLAVLPEVEMRECLDKVLAENGYIPSEKEPGKAVREVEGLRVEIDPATLSVRVVAERETRDLETIKVKVRREETAPGIQETLGKEIAEATEHKRRLKGEELAREATAGLAGALPAARAEIDAVNHRWLAEALKRKAAQLGEVQRVEENEAERTLSISIKV